jgi:hypothetical protein
MNSRHPSAARAFVMFQLQYDANVGILQISVNGQWQEAHITGITGMAQATKASVCFLSWFQC